MLSRTEVTKALRQQLRIIQAFRVIHAKLPAQAMQAFLEIAMHEGLSVTELSDRLGIAMSSTSRNVTLLSAINRFGEPGMSLIEARPGSDPRVKRLYLTRDGHALADTITAYMQ